LTADSEETRIQPVRIAGTGHFVPEGRLTNAMLEARGIGTTESWIAERTGIQERRIVEPGTPVSALALPASREALKVAGVEPEAVEAIVFGTSTPDHISPPSACMLQRSLGATNAAAFDVIAGCSGFVVCLDLAVSMVASRRYRNVLVIGADVMSAIINPKQRETCIIFGDGAGAALVQAAEPGEGSILKSILGAEGNDEVMYVRAGGSRYPASAETLAAEEHYFQMSGRKVYKFAVKKVASLVEEVLEGTGYGLDDVDWFVPHQMNELILKNAFREKLGVPWEKVVINLDKYGNTTAGTVPIALDEAVRDGRIKPGDLVVLVVVGAGLSWGATLLRY
jgi:3-oxoacyl-[acyl-carrier-protein] synthase-3